MEDKSRILIVDDNISLCKTLSFVLGRKGYAVATAGDGPEAIERVKGSPFDMIFMDIKMPLMDGVETYRRIKQIRPEAAVMMMTAYAVEDLVQQALEEGAYGIVYKPLDIERVIAVIEEARRAGEGALILVVDDDPGTCITLKNILTRKSYKVGIAHTGEEAIAMTREAAYDIIFIDMRLPTINGLETYLTIREINLQAVAIMMTAYRQEVAELVEEALKNSAYTCLYKPLDMEELLRLVEGIRRERRSGGAGVIQSHEELDVYRLAFKAVESRHVPGTCEVPGTLQAIFRAVVHAGRGATADESRHVPGTCEVPGTWQASKLNDAESEAAETQTWLRFAVECGYLAEEEARNGR